MIYVIGFIWYLVGCAGFVYWWTKDYKLDFNSFILMLTVGYYGICTWVIGYLLHGLKKI